MGLEANLAVRVGLVPVNGLRLVLDGDAGERHEAHAGDRRKGLAGCLGDGTVQFGLGHRFSSFIWGAEKSDRPETGAVV